MHCRFVPLLLALILPNLAHADPFFKLVRYACDRDREAIVISYHGTFAQDSDIPNPLKAVDESDAWDPWDLVQTDRTHWVITGVSQVERRCALSDGEYRVTIVPRPGNRNINGNCGAWITAAVKVERAGQELSNVQFERSCNLPDHPIITRVVVRTGDKPPSIVEQSSEEFYR